VENPAALLIFPKPTWLELELAPGHWSRASIGCRGVIGPVPRPLAM